MQLLNSRAMQRAADFITNLTQKIDLPRLDIDYRGEGLAESYSAEVWRATLKVKSTTPLGMAYGVSRSLAAWRSKAVEWLGEQRPLYRRRLLFLEGDSEVSVGIALKLILPQALTLEQPLELLQERLIALCQGTIELGFNGLAFGSFFSSQLVKRDMSEQALRLIDSVLTEFGLALIALPMSAIFPPHYDPLFDLWPNCRGMIYRSCGLAVASSSATTCENLIHEAEAVASAIHNRADLLFYLPHQALNDSHGWRKDLWSRLCDELPLQTSLVFATTAADPPTLFHSPHPFWEELRRSPDVSATPLLPLLNCGAIGCGAGLWPLLHASCIEATLAACRRHPFEGLIAIAPALPTALGLAHSNLWVTGQRLWTPYATAADLTAMWFGLYWPAIEYAKAAPLLDEATALAYEVMGLFTCATKSYEQWRAALESAFARLKNLACQPWEELQCASSHPQQPTLQSYFQPFYADLRRLLFHLMLTHQVNLPQVVEERDLGTGFWTHLAALPGQGIRAGAVVSRRSSITPDELTPSLRALYHANYGW